MINQAAGCIYPAHIPSEEKVLKTSLINRRRVVPQ